MPFQTSLLTLSSQIIVPSHLRLDALGDPTEPLIKVSLDFHDDLAIIRNSETQKYCGLLPHQTARPLTLICDKHKATLISLLSIKRAKKGEPPMQDLLILVYGLGSLENVIADTLDEAGLFLQQPHGIELLTPYRNPHILSRPGSSNIMTDLSEQTIISSRSTQTLTGNRSLQHQVQDIFDSAQGPDIFKEAVISPRLSTVLKP